MPELLAQLRAYGRQIESDGLVGAPRGTVATQTSAAEQADDSGPDDGGTEPPLSAAGAVSGPPRSRNSFRPSSMAVAVAAAVAAVTVVATSVFVPSVGPEGGVMDKRSGLVGFCLIVAGCTSGGDGGGLTKPAVSPPSSASSPSASSSAGLPSAQPSDGALPTLVGGAPPNDIEVVPGTYTVNDLGAPVQVTVPPGWTAFDETVLHGPDEEASVAFLSGEWMTYTDPCNWVTGQQPVGPTVDDLVTAMVAQEPTVNEPPQPITMDGYSGTELVISTPPSLDIASCYTGEYVYLIDDLHRQTSAEKGGVPQTFRILDLNGERGIISFWSSASASEATKAQLTAVVDSIKIG
jgi:hypothetical protein